MVGAAVFHRGDVGRSRSNVEEGDDEGESDDGPMIGRFQSSGLNCAVAGSASGGATRLRCLHGTPIPRSWRAGNDSTAPIWLSTDGGGSSNSEDELPERGEVGGLEEDDDKEDERVSDGWLVVWTSVEATSGIGGNPTSSATGRRIGNKKPSSSRSWFDTSL